MNLQNIQILIGTNGNMATRPAIQYGIWLAGLLSLPVYLLGIAERSHPSSGIEKLFDEAISDLEIKGISYKVSFDQGRASVVMARHAHLGRYVTIAGPLGRPIWRRYIQGRSFRRLMAKIETPIVYVPQLLIPPKKILLCMGGLSYTRSVVRWTSLLAQKNGSSVTLYHVVEPITLDYPVAQTVHEHWQDIIHTDTPQGTNIKYALDEFEKKGIQYDLRVFQGNAVKEILGEIRRGNYDLISMGSMYSAQGLRHLYMPNVTAEVAEVSGRPVFTVRVDQDLLGK